jgi:3-methyladenine DNA glycosylase AlkD
MNNMTISILDQIIEDLKTGIIAEKAHFFPKFFKTGPGGYGEGDIFIGITVPHVRQIVKLYWKDISLEDTLTLLKDPIHEYRLTALFILVEKFTKTKDHSEKEVIVESYLCNIDYINNWDLIDTSAYKILGVWLYTRDRSILYKLAKENHLWKQRVAIISTFYFIKKNDYTTALEIAEILLNHKHDLIHKAVGWMLREIGNRNYDTEYDFLEKHYKIMPRTMLRYATEKFDESVRQMFLKGQI